MPGQPSLSQAVWNINCYLQAMLDASFQLQTKKAWTRQRSFLHYLGTDSGPAGGDNEVFMIHWERELLIFFVSNQTRNVSLRRHSPAQKIEMFGFLSEENWHSEFFPSDFPGHAQTRHAPPRAPVQGQPELLTNHASITYMIWMYLQRLPGDADNLDSPKFYVTQPSFWKRMALGWGLPWPQFWG